MSCVLLLVEASVWFNCLGWGAPTPSTRQSCAAAVVGDMVGPQTRSVATPQGQGVKRSWRWDGGGIASSWHGAALPASLALPPYRGPPTLPLSSILCPVSQPCWTNGARRNLQPVSRGLFSV